MPRTPADAHTLKSRIFDIAAPAKGVTTLRLNFSGNDSVIGCWQEPLFHALSLKLKVHEFYHTALKAESTVQTPPISAGSASDSVTLDTLHYQYDKAVVRVDYTWRWTQAVAVETTSAASSEMAMDSDEATDRMMRVPDVSDVLGCCSRT